MESTPDTKRPPPLHLPPGDDSEDVVARVAEVIEEVDLPDDDEEQRRAPFSPMLVGKSLGRLGHDAAHQKELRTELLSPEGQAQIPHPT